MDPREEAGALARGDEPAPGEWTSDLFTIVSCLASTKAWSHFCAHVPEGMRKQRILVAVRAFLDAVPRSDPPPVPLGRKPGPRPVIAIATELERSVAAWEHEDEPSLSMLVMASAFLDAIGAAPPRASR